MSIRGLLIALGVAAAIAIATTTLASHTGDHAFLVLPAGIPVIGGPLTLEAALFGVSTGVGHRSGGARGGSPFARTPAPRARRRAPGCAREDRCGDRHRAQPDPGHRAQRHRDSRCPAHAWLALAPRPRVARPGGACRADRAGGVDHPCRGDGGARLRLGRAHPLQRAGLASRATCRRGRRRRSGRSCSSRSA